jgi:hypothetical protein
MIHLKLLRMNKKNILNLLFIKPSPDWCLREQALAGYICTASECDHHRPALGRCIDGIGGHSKHHTGAQAWTKNPTA